MYPLARLATFVITATFSLHAAGCESSAASRHAAAASKPVTQISQQLIVKFKPQSVACTAQAIARFSKAAHVPLTWLRPMSGDACVLIQTASNSEEMTTARERLKKHPHIEWVEIDAPMQHH